MQFPFKDPDGGYRHILYYCMGLGFALGVAVLNIPPALDALMEHYQASYLQISLLITIMFWPHTLVLLPGGILADRLNLILASAICMSLITGGNLIALLFPGIEAAMLGRMVCGLGTGFLFVVAMTLMAVHAPAGRAGAYHAIFGGCVSSGSIASFLCLPGLTALHWGWAYGLPALLAGLCLLPAPFMRAKPRISAKGGFAPMLDVARTREAWLLGLAHALSWGTVIGLGNWTPALFAESMGESASAQYAWLGALLMLVSGLGRFSGGAIILKIRPLRVIWLSMFLIALSYLSLYAFPAPIVVVTAAVFTLWCASANFGAIFQAASYAAGPASLGSMMGLVNFVANLGAIIITMICGWFKEESGSFSGAFIYISVAALAAGWLTARFLRDRAQ